ncbi:disulfide bond formation protein B [Phaeobacter italicus]|uniref:disulfide bond formation protein B n=1 Tax=Phaeobacter italicus TaxID=481446 RepID=UPI00242A338D|nr:disulfide bond formation protein B [Phaeobacter italicus]MCI5101566.1 disulfide bond formation protein B [Phaeobacter italicus]
MSRLLIILASAGSAALLLGAFGFQYIGEMAPCKLCIWQRYPHGAAVLIGAVALAFPLLILPYLGALAALATAGVGAYHTGVERGWWEGPSTCTSGPIGNLSADELMQQIMSAPLVRCDDVPWEMLGLSMASWNAVASFVLALLWIAAANHMRKA